MRAHQQCLDAVLRRRNRVRYLADQIERGLAFAVQFAIAHCRIRRSPLASPDAQDVLRTRQMRALPGGLTKRFHFRSPENRSAPAPAFASQRAKTWLING